MALGGNGAMKFKPRTIIGNELAKKLAALAQPDFSRTTPSTKKKKK